jgi:Holliday junction resolvase RusA-like endonuclease
MTFIVVFTVEGIPQGKGRPRFRRAGNFVQTYTDAKTKSYEATIRDTSARAMGSARPLESPVSVDLYIRVPCPSSFSKRRRNECFEGRERPTKKPDIDNIIKAYLDGMNGIVYLDDTQVVRVSAKKVYSMVAGVDVCVREEIL